MDSGQWTVRECLVATAQGGKTFNVSAEAALTQVDVEVRQSLEIRFCNNSKKRGDGRPAQNEPQSTVHSPQTTNNFLERLG